jgi:hypothetical protein
VALCLFGVFVTPQNILAAESGRSFTTPAPFGGAILWALVCYLKRKNAIGGWLLYYFAGVYAGFLISIVLVFSSGGFSNYNPFAWDDKSQYFLFIITTIPNDVLLLSQLVLSIPMMSKKHRDWKYIKILQYVLIAEFLFSLISIPVEFKYWPESVPFSIYSSVFSLIWFLYFRQSARVYHVYKLKQWNWEVFHRLGKTKDVLNQKLIKQSVIQQDNDNRLKMFLGAIKKSLPEFVLVIGCILIVLRLLFPPKYVIMQGVRFPYSDKFERFYPVSDFYTALLQSLGIAIITGVIFYLLKKRKS